LRSCPKCRKDYAQPDLRFCLDDGAALVASAIVAVGDSVAYQATVDSGPLPLLTDNDLAPEEQPLPAGLQVGEYVVEGQIGAGGMGMIFSASHPVIGKRVALKVLNRMMANNPDVVARFITEAKAVNRIRHRHIVDIFSFGTLPDGRHYFVMEFLEGESLAGRFKRSGPLEWSEAIEMWLQLADAIEAAHEQGIVHRDLKPDNVFLCKSRDGFFVKVLDFGIAKLLGDASGGISKTNTGMPIGTPAYMSPEQASGLNVDHRTDLYAFGLVMYESIAGRPPFGGNTLIELLNHHLNDPPPPLAGLVEISTALDNLVMKLLEKEPEARFPDMAALRKALIELRDLAIKQGQPLYHGSTTPKATRRRSVGAIAGAGVSLLAIAGALGWQLTRKPAPPAPKIVAPPPPVAAALAPAPPKPTAPPTGTLALTVNSSAALVYLDESATERSVNTVAAGGPQLKVVVPADVDRWLRVEASGMKPEIVPIKITGGESRESSVTLQPLEAPKPVAAHHSSKPHAAPAPPAAKPAPPAPKPAPSEKSPSNPNMINPF
jgi:serine/threonine-protein kinase